MKYLFLFLFSTNCFASFVIPNNAVTTAKIANNAVTNAKLAAVNMAFSSTISFSTTSSTPVDVTGSGVSLTTIGRPVLVFLQGGNTTCELTGIGSGTAYPISILFYILRDGVQITSYTIAQASNITVAGGFTLTQIGNFQFIDTGVSAANHTYKLQAAVGIGSGNTAGISTCQLGIMEL